jgi:hypothetical protein
VIARHHYDANTGLGATRDGGAGPVAQWIDESDECTELQPRGGCIVRASTSVRARPLASARTRWPLRAIAGCANQRRMLAASISHMAKMRSGAP